MSLRTLSDVFFAVVERQHPQVMLQRLGEGWSPISSETWRQRIIAVSSALRKWGVGRGDRVAILSENRPEWTIADFASLLLGAVTVPVYATLTAEQTRLVDVHLIGSYAIAPAWADGHHTGYYPYVLLRDRCPCDVCAADRDPARSRAPEEAPA